MKANMIFSDLWCISAGVSRSFLLIGSEKALLVDSGDGSENILAAVTQITDRPVIAVNTHLHWDHTGGNRLFDRVYAHPDRLAETCDGAELLLTVEDGYTFELGGISAKVISTPGHTPGSVSLLCSEHAVLFAGDTVSDEPIYMHHDYCDFIALKLSLEKLILPSPQFDSVLCCHGTCLLPASHIEKMIKCIASVISGELHGELVQREFKGKTVLFRQFSSNGTSFYCAP